MTKYIQEAEDKIRENEHLQEKLLEQNDEIGRLAELVGQYQKSESKVSGYESMIGSWR